MSDSPWVIEVGAQDFERAVIDRSHHTPVVVDFWAPWCGPCRALGPVLERLVHQRNGAVVLAKVNVDEAQELAAALQIQSIPAVKGFRDGQLVLEFTGVLPEPHLNAFLDRLMPSEADRLVREAEALEEAEPARAEALYRQAHQTDEPHEAARVGLARVLLALGQDSEVADLLEPVGDEGPLGAEAQRLKGLLSLKGLATGGDEATLRRRLQAEPDNAEVRYELGCALARTGKHEDALELLLSAGEKDHKLLTTKVREAMVQVFYALGSDHPLSDEYRSKLSRLMY